MKPFELSGPAHLLTLFTIVLVGAGVVGLGRTGRAEALTRLALSLLLGVALAVYLIDLGLRRPIRVFDVLPLHLCDMAIFVALFSLMTKNKAATELLYFWTTTGTLLATVTPAIREGAPSIRFFTYFALHGGVILAAVYLVIGLGHNLQRGAAVRAWLLTNAYAAAVLAIDQVFDKNYLYLRAKPRGETLLDLFGPWPIYILVCEILALVLFLFVAQVARLSQNLKRRGRSGITSTGS